MFHPKIILKFLSVLLLFNGGFMSLILPLAIKDEDGTALGIGAAVILHLILGIFLLWLNKDADGKELRKRDGFLVVTLGWVMMSVFGCLPYLFTGTIPDVTNAFFETISGFTTTGASILDDIESMPRSILLWRSLTQWIGGMGIIVLAVAILPILGIGSVQLFSAEAPGLKPDKIKPRIADTAKRLWFLYMALTVSEVILLWLGDMNLFDAINHSLTTLSTGGFSTKQASIAHWDSAYIHYVITGFMFLGGTNFILIYWLTHLKFKKLIENEEFRFYGGLVLVFSIVVSIALYLKGDLSGEESFRTSLFQVVSIVSTTGYATADYTLWGSGLTMFFFLLLFSGGSAGSTAGGVKMVRHLILFKNSGAELKRQLHSNAIIPIRIDGKAIPMEMTSSVLAFMMLYIVLFALGSILLAAMGVDFDTAIGAVATSLGNVGPGINEVSPSYSFNFLPAAAKWELGFLMLVGRLELFTVLMLFNPYYWRKN
ncbi:MAG: TrkH family potassium uptake protein [Bacteroidetes bacterium]|nr:TrkH family potassium uptake protein [Bacteroidota bacterium]